MLASPADVTFYNSNIHNVHRNIKLLLVKHSVVLVASTTMIH